uniref:Uncharacterized protein n=1 Tax=Mycena chlorophos TaxID=658473 RepID=A0ABQ0KUZ9_MYCCL|nr:predicted protein [Mycena chlorophos]
MFLRFALPRFRSSSRVVFKITGAACVAAVGVKLALGSLSSQAATSSKTRPGSGFPLTDKNAYAQRREGSANATATALKAPNAAGGHSSILMQVVAAAVAQQMHVGGPATTCTDVQVRTHFNVKRRLTHNKPQVLLINALPVPLPIHAPTSGTHTLTLLSVVHAIRVLVPEPSHAACEESSLARAESTKILRGPADTTFMVISLDMSRVALSVFSNIGHIVLIPGDAHVAIHDRQAVEGSSDDTPNHDRQAGLQQTRATAGAKHDDDDEGSLVVSTRGDLRFSADITGTTVHGAARPSRAPADAANSGDDKKPARLVHGASKAKTQHRKFASGKPGARSKGRAGHKFGIYDGIAGATVSLIKRVVKTRGKKGKKGENTNRTSRSTSTPDDIDA